MALMTCKSCSCTRKSFSAVREYLCNDCVLGFKNGYKRVLISEHKWVCVKLFD